MRFALAALLLLWQAAPRVAPEPKHFRFERGVAVAANASGRACAVLDGEAYIHAEPALADLRLFAGGAETPYALTMSETAMRGDSAQVLNLGERGGHVSFDLAMPARPYSMVDLQLNGEDFLATAKVGGSDAPGKPGTALGTFTLFDLSGQRLGRSTSFALAESTFAYLHVDLAASAAPGTHGFALSPRMVDGAEIPPSREAQTVFTDVAGTTQIVQKNGSSVAEFDVPAHLPVERIRFELDPADKANFSRTVEVIARGIQPAGSNYKVEPEAFSGAISRVRLKVDGKEIREESLTVSETLASNGQTPAHVSVAVLNEDDKPLAIRAVTLEMRERKVCFDNPSGPVTMYYGDAKLASPRYDYSKLFQPTEAASAARLGAEQANPAYVARAVREKPLTERHPEILWVALLAVVSVLGVVAFRSAKRV